MHVLVESGLTKRRHPTVQAVERSVYGYFCPTPEKVKSAWDTLGGSVRVRYTSPLRQVQSQKPVKIGLV